MGAVSWVNAAPKIENVSANVDIVVDRHKYINVWETPPLLLHSLCY